MGPPLRDPEELHERRSVTPPGCLGAGILESRDVSADPDRLWEWEVMVEINCLAWGGGIRISLALSGVERLG